MASVLSRFSDASATSLMCAGRLFSPACFPFGVEVEPELRGDHHLPAKRRQRLAHQFFVDERAVDLGRIEERDAAFHRGPDHRDHLLLVLRPARNQSSFPCSRAREPRLPGRSFPSLRFCIVSPSFSLLQVRVGPLGRYPDPSDFLPIALALLTNAQPAGYPGSVRRTKPTMKHPVETAAAADRRPNCARSWPAGLPCLLAPQRTGQRTFPALSLHRRTSLTAPCSMTYSPA